MTKMKYVIPPSRPFVLFSMGLDGYEGESELWNVPRPAGTLTVYHILVRIKHEMSLLRQRTGEDFYLFGTHKNFAKAGNRFVEDYGRHPIDILFTVNSKDESRLTGLQEPCNASIVSSPQRWRRMVSQEEGQSRAIPKEINLWGWDDKKAYYGLRLAKFRCFRPVEVRYLRGCHLFYYLSNAPVRNWCHFTMGTLYSDSKSGFKTVRDRRILATAKLEYPYVYEVHRR
jgi:hypothetical protein